MRKTLIALLLMAALLVAGCQGSSNGTAGTATSQQSEAYASATPEPAAAATRVQPTVELAAAPPGCTVISPQPTAGPTEQSVFPQVEDADWKFGPTDAAVTFVEYGDFQ